MFLTSSTLCHGNPRTKLPATSIPASFVARTASWTCPVVIFFLILRRSSSL
ncbi:MAG: hypothetical protein RXS42_04055 [Nitrososphaeria archaeon]